jgi:hypothetical protein
LEYDPGTPLGNLFADIPNNGKTKIALIVPVQNISKEEAETLALPLANKRAKSPTGVAIPKRGRGGKASRGGQRANVKKETIKEEVKDEKDIKIEEEIQEDSDEPPKAHNVLPCKRKNISNSMYPVDQYDTN